jgi:hypothetical protein
VEARQQSYASRIAMLIQRRRQPIWKGVFAAKPDSFGRMGSVSPSNIEDKNAQRRSQRVIVKLSVMVLAEGADKKPVSEETRTVTANAHGAMILLGLKVSVGQLLTLRNSRTGEEVPCRVVYVSPHAELKTQADATPRPRQRRRTSKLCTI